MYTVLICDDEQDILRSLSLYLSSEGYHVVSCSNGKDAIEALSLQTVHLVILDIMMPELDGLSTTAEIRKQHNIPIILLTAKSEDGDKVLGLNLGADDYMTKPFKPIELLARVKAQLRRYTKLGSMAEKSEQIQIGDLILDNEKKFVSLYGSPLALTPKEYDILQLLLASPGKVFSSKEIYKNVWKEDFLDNTSVVAVHIRHLR